MIALLSPDLAERASEATGIPLSGARILLPALLILAGYLAGVLLEVALVKTLPVLVKRSRTRLDDVIVQAARGPAKPLGTLTGVAAAILVTPAPAVVHAWTGRVLVVILALAAIVILARLVGALVLTYGDRARIIGPARNVTRRLVVILVYGVGALLVLDNQGVSITPLLTTLGLAGLAVALAFQDTLSNFFAGIYVQTDRPLDVGHYVKLEDLSIEGYVVDVGWRTTKIRTLANNIVVIPNARVASSVVTDYDLPEPRMSLLVRIPVPHGADPREIEKILVEEAKLAAAGGVPGLLATPEPFVRFIPGFTENGMEFTLICQVEKFVDQYLAQHEVRHRIKERLKREGIDIAVPYRVVRVEDATNGASMRALDALAPHAAPPRPPDGATPPKRGA